MTKILGITGSREEPTVRQAAVLGVALERLRGAGFTDLVHGSCVGADALAHHVANSLGYRTQVRPPINAKHRAWVRGSTNFPEAEYHDRNRMIVVTSSYLIALPRWPERDERSRRSGTWATVRMARQAGTPVLIIWPSGWAGPDNPGGSGDHQGDGDRDQREGRQDLDPRADPQAGQGHRQ